MANIPSPDLPFTIVINGKQLIHPIWWRYLRDFQAESAGVSGSGYIVANGTSLSSRSIIPASDKVIITNQNGISGNTTIDVDEAELTLSNIGGDVALSQIADIPANTVLGNDTGASSPPTTFSCTSAGRALLDDVDAATQRSTLGLVIGTNVQAWDTTLDSFAAYNTNGLITQTAANTFTGRTNTGTANEITVTNGDGISGNPTYSLPSSLTMTSKTLTDGTYNNPTINYVNIQGVITPSQITSNQNDYNPTGLSTATTLRLDSDASRNITGITAPATNGRILIIHNIGTNDIVLTDEDTNSSAANRFNIGSSITLTTDTSILIQYDNTSSRWRAISRIGGSGETSFVVQRVSQQTGAVSTTTTAIPSDDTIPQNTEGGQFLTVSITPTSSSNILVIDIWVVLAHNGTNISITTALFQDSTANALAATNSNGLASANFRIIQSFRHIMTAGTTSSTTFNVRSGGATGSTLTFNGSNAARLMGGVLASSITVTEVTS